jgi:hypothetical protein
VLGTSWNVWTKIRKNLRSCVEWKWEGRRGWSDRGVVAVKLPNMEVAITSKRKIPQPTPS